MKDHYTIQITEYHETQVGIYADSPEDAVREARGFHESRSKTYEQMGGLKHTATVYSAVRHGEPIMIVDLSVDRNGYTIMTEHRPEPKIGRGKVIV